MTARLTETRPRFPAICSLVAAGGSLFGHRRQHLADVRGQEVVHLVALRD